ncbi:MAG: SufD family Fe-S cluster assembly protein [Candidatus Bilamarchaeum sp.]|jgi:Fe-S cluster assembly scaffold protein SufB
MNNIIAAKSMDIEISKDSVILIPDNSDIKLTFRPKNESKVELKVGKNCRVSTLIINSEKCSIRQDNLVGENSIIHSYGVWTNNATGEIFNHLIGENSEAYDLHLFNEKNENKLAINSVLRHANKNTKGNITVRGIAGDSARVKLDGMIKIEKNGGGAESFLTQNVILLNPKSHATANPELEIENNDVSSRHAASVAQIDEEKIFYLMSRGVSREEARKMIVSGFLEAIVEKIEDDEIRGQINKKIF